MSFVIKNGANGTTAKVDTNQRLQVAAISEEVKDHSAESGDKYNINTGDITLTDATATSVLYIKNNEDRNLVVTALIYNLGASTSGTGDGLVEVHRNPTAGTIVSDAVNVAVGPTKLANQNFGSTKSLAVNAYKGDTADNDFTVSDGVTITSRLSSPLGRIVVSLGAIELPKGASIGISYTPQTSNSSQICQFAAACFLRSAAVQGD
jgi:hypothetical protein